MNSKQIFMIVAIVTAQPGDDRYTCYGTEYDRWKYDRWKYDRWKYDKQGK